METIKIAHLYYDLMNLYGEHGNLLALRHHLEEHKIRVITHYLSIEDEIDFAKYDIFYIGSGNKEAFDITRRNIIKYKQEIKEALSKNKFFFVTGNALDLFGKYYRPLEGDAKETLGVFSYEAYEEKNRIVGEQVYTYKEMDYELIGFVNRNSTLRFVKEPHLFDVKSGAGYVKEAITEGIQKKNFYGTYLLGPLFIRNPYFTEHIIKEILNTKKLHYEFFCDKLETKAYLEYKKNMLHEE